MSSKTYSVYIMTNWEHSVFYIGVSGDPDRRVIQHKNKLIDGFTKKYNLTKLVFIEAFNDPLEAIQSEKIIKKWSRKKKIDLINSMNPEWKDLAENL